MARAWFFLVLLNSSSFSAIRLSISCLTCPSSSWARRTLFSSCSRVPSASSRAPCSSSFSCSRRRLCLSRSWMERPPSPSWSRRSLISSARFLFSRLTMSSCSRPSSPAAFSLKSSEVLLRPSSWEAATSAETSAALDCHSPRTLSKFLPLFSVMRAAACTLSYSIARSSSSLFIRVLDFSALATLVVRESTSSSLSTILACSLLRADSSSSTRPMPSVSKRDFHSWISAWALERAFRATDFLMSSFSIFSLRFSRSVAIILYLVNREERSLLSASARALVSSSWVVTEILPLFMLAMAASNSSIWRGLGVLQLGGDRDLTLVHVGNGCFQLIDLAGQVLVLDLQPLLGGLCLIEGTGHLVESGVCIHNAALKQLTALVQISLALHSILKVATSIAEVQLHVGLVLLGLHLVGVEIVNLLSQVSHGVVMLHTQSSKGSLVSNVQLLELSLQAGKLSLALLVELDLGGRVGASFLQP